MINELSRGDSTGPGVDHDIAVIEPCFSGAGPHSDIHRTSRSSSVYESDRRRIIVG